MKKISIVLMLLFTVLTVRAQFQAGKAYLGASLTGLNLNYNSQDGFNFGVEAKAGYLFEDNWMVLGQAGPMPWPITLRRVWACVITLSRTACTWDLMASLSMTITATTM